MEESNFQLHEELLKLQDQSLVLEYEVELSGLDADDTEARLNGDYRAGLGAFCWKNGPGEQNGAKKKRAGRMKRQSRYQSRVG